MVDQPEIRLEVTELMNDAAVQLSLALEANDAPYGELVEAAHAFMRPFREMQINRDWGTAVLDPDHDLLLRWSGGHCAHGG